MLHSISILEHCSPATNLVKISVVLTVLVLPGPGDIFGRNLFQGETLVTPEVLSEFTDVITDTTNDLGFEANVTQPARLGKQSCAVQGESGYVHMLSLSSLSLSPPSLFQTAVPLNKLYSILPTPMSVL